MLFARLPGLALALLAAPALAQLPAPGGDVPIEIAADELEVRQNDGIATFRGNVDAVQGDLTLTADAVDVHYAGGPAGGEGGSISRVVATGNVVVTSPRDIARGHQGVYDLERRTIVMSGDVVLTRDGNVLRGSRLEVDLASGVSRMLPQGEGGRVRALFVPDGGGGG
jgi:lipopolysaccharide export system protein LptA